MESILMESIFSAASRGEVVRRRSGRQGRDGALKMGWTKPWPPTPAMGIESRWQSQRKVWDVREERVSAVGEG